ncbi:MAG: glycosyl hydrolase, partial [Gemmatimonadetes bacterium]|nr:glycosyl hydrolase [Gemmatimonadota bacterium]NIQ59754.1 glycosyl hydrolase [Gemmatimonadota bacterium]NIU79956.1 glycosyl hydrolase [Gammaproteobacteria bacterium]NIX48418.1 glycosyl hydrolase [Gemmatimonadota bacterium]NIY12853.1 glycosyl hydrolase [Gemmatimonadota bacterium]
EEEAPWWESGGVELSMEEGLHSFDWNLRYPGATEFPGMILWAASTRFGPVAAPGEYRVRLTADGTTREQGFRVLKNPLLPEVTQADLDEQFRLSLEIRDRVTEANDAVRLIRGIERQIEERLEARPEDAELESAAQSLRAELDAVEGEIYQVRNQSNQDPLNFPIKLNNRLAALMGVVQNADGRPTEQSYEVFELLSGQLDEQLRRLDEVLDTGLDRFNQLLDSRDLEAVERVMIPEHEEEDEGEEG